MSRNPFSTESNLTRYIGLGVIASMALFSCGELHEPPELQAVARPMVDRSPAQILATIGDNVAQDLSPEINASETAVAQVTTQVLEPWRTAWIDGDAEAFGALLADDAVVSDMSRPLPAAWRTESGIDEHRQDGLETVQGDQADGMVRAYLASFPNIEHVALDIHNVTDHTPDSLKVRAWLDVRGIDAEGARRHDRGWMQLELTQKGGTWTLTHVEIDSMETLRAATAAFVDATREAGLSEVPLFERLEALRRGGYAISVGDFDGDTFPDAYIGGWGQSNLYRNNGDGSFEDVTGKVGLGSEDRVKAAALVDLDNDGTKDFVLSRFIDETSEDVLVYLGAGDGTLRKAKDAVTKIGSYDRAMPLTVADFDNDGFNDLYVGFPGARDFTYLDSSANPLKTEGLFINRGDGTFDDVTENAGLGSKLGVAAYPHASVKADFDGDGRIDLMVADDRRGPSLVYRNTGNGTFSEVGADVGISNSAWAMGIAVGDYDGDGLADVYMSNIDFLAAKRIDPMMDEEMELFHGNRLYHNSGDGTFEDVTDKAGVGWAGEAAAGSGWFDYDNDGDLDLYVLNGLWTGPGRTDLSSLFIRAYASELRAEIADPGLAKRGGLDPDAISLRNPGFNNMIMTALTHFRGDLASPLAGEVSDAPTLSMGGHQRNALYRNNGDGTFTEVGWLAGVDTSDDGYMPAFADVDQDGRVDLFARACDPGTTQYRYPSLRLYKNVLENDHHNLAVKLRGDGEKSNLDAVGAHVRIRIGDAIQVREIDTVSGASQSEMVAQFGLGTADVVDELTITWPSGRVEAYTDVAAGRVEFTEGQR